MTIEQAVEMCKTGFADAYLDQPFGPDWWVMRHGEGGKVYALIFERQAQVWLDLKAEPADVVVLSQAFKGIFPGYHMNKRHWLTVVLDGSVPQDLTARLIEQSYALTLPKAKKSS